MPLVTRRQVRRALPLCALTFIIFIYIIIVHVDSPETQTRTPETDTGTTTHQDQSLQLEDVFIAVKTSGRFHQTRLRVILKTWISLTRDHTFIFTDAEDKELTSAGFHVEVTLCPPDHSQEGLSCKMSAEYNSFMSSTHRWFCHVDDDNYVNPGALLSLLRSFLQKDAVYVGRASLSSPLKTRERRGNSTAEVSFWFATGGAGFCISRTLAEQMAPWARGAAFVATSALIRLPDDCTMGFIVEQRLGLHMVHSLLFHSHLEDLDQLEEIHKQVTLSYGVLNDKLNTVRVRGNFNTEQDPTRFMTVHCLLYPFTSWCP